MRIDPQLRLEEDVHGHRQAHRVTPLEDSPYLGWPGRPHLSLGNQLALGLFWLPNNVLWTGLLLIVLPERVLALVGARAATGVLSWTSILGTIVAIIVSPVFGLISDHFRSRLGRRRPLMVWGSLLSLSFLLAIAYAPSLPLFVVGLVGVQFLNNVAQSAYQGLIPDLVPPSQRGEASGYMALYNQAGVIIGGVLGAFFSAIAFVWATIGLLILSLGATLGLVREPDSRALASEPVWVQLRHLLHLGPGYRNFWIVFWTRFLVLVGLYVLEQYLLYYLQFVLGIRSPQTDVFLILMVLSATALVSSLGAGYLSDRIGDRRRLVAFSGILQGICALLFVFSHSLTTVFVAAAIFGLGYGAYQSTDWALVVDVLPGRTAARDMGIWSISTTGPQMTGFIFGWLLSVLVIPHLGISLGYRALFALTAVFFVLGSLLVWKVRKAGPEA